MIKNFSVGNFQSFRDKNTLCFERQANDDSLKDSYFIHQKTEFLRSVAVYGANASGKSNLWKALLFFRQFVANSLQASLINEKIQVMPFLLNTKTENEPSFFEIEIYSGKKRFQYGFEVSSKKIHKEWLFEFPNKKKLFERTNDEIDHNPLHFHIIKKDKFEVRIILKTLKVHSYKWQNKGEEISSDDLKLVEK